MNRIIIDMDGYSRNTDSDDLPLIGIIILPDISLVTFPFKRDEILISSSPFFLYRNAVFPVPILRAYIVDTSPKNIGLERLILGRKWVRYSVTGQEVGVVCVMSVRWIDITAKATITLSMLVSVFQEVQNNLSPSFQTGDRQVATSPFSGGVATPGKSPGSPAIRFIRW